MNIFDSVKQTKPTKSRFNLSHDVKLSFNMGELIPTLCLECVPGDKFNLACDSLTRFAPLVAPTMHRFNSFMHYFFVPTRILWNNWENFITNTEVAGNVPSSPFVIIDDNNYTRLADYMGIPTPPVGGPTEAISILPFAAYQKVYNDYYRDQNLQIPVGIDDTPLVDGDNSANFPGFGTLRLRSWEHDYFTSCLPFAQKGAAVSIPMAFLDQEVRVNSGPGGNGTIFDVAVGTDPAVADNGTANNPAILNPQTLYVDNSGMTGQSSINDLRRAYRLQEWLEKNARGGTRYNENILAHFGVVSSDKRLQRPEYITGNKTPVSISEVLNTAGENSDPASRPQGDMAGHAVSVTTGRQGTYFCEEHGYIIGIMSMLPVPAYQQGIPKHFLKTVDAFQHYWPSFAHIGEQEVQNKELYAFQGATSNDVFGYVPRYAEYKFQPSRVCGDFRDSLSFWHAGRIFSTPPALNSDFIEMDQADNRRIFAITDPTVQTLYAHVFHDIQAIRPMPKFGTPTF